MVRCSLVRKQRPLKDIGETEQRPALSTSIWSSSGGSFGYTGLQGQREGFHHVTLFPPADH